MANNDGRRARDDYIPQLQADGSSAEALKHSIVGGQTVAGNASTDWLYPGNAKCIEFVSLGAARMQVRGGGGDGLATDQYRKLAPVAGIDTSAADDSGSARTYIIPHEFRFEDTSGSTNNITWSFHY